MPVCFVWLLACSIALRASSAVYRIPYLSLGAELSRDYDDRTSTMGLRTLFGLAGHPGCRGAFVSDFLSGHRRRLRTQTALRRISAHGSGLRRVDDRFRPDRHFGHAALSHVAAAATTPTGPRFVSGFRIAMRNTPLPQHLALHDGFLPGGRAELQHGDSLLHLVCAHQPQRDPKPDSDLLLRRCPGRRGPVDVAGPPHGKTHSLHHGYASSATLVAHGYRCSSEPAARSAPATPSR